MGVPALKQIIGSTTTQRDNRDDSPDRINWMKLKCAVGRLPQMSLVGCRFRRNDKQPRRSHIRVKHNQTETLKDFCNGMVENLKKARCTLADHQAKLMEMRRAKV
jgi:hypothetical protein